MENRQGWWDALIGSCRELAARDRRNQWVASGWIFFFVVAFVATSALLRGDRELPAAAGWGLVGLTVALGVGTVLAFRRFLVEADELQRKIQLDALAIGFGAGLVGSWTLRLVELAGGPALDLGDDTVIMILAYVSAIVAGTRRYA